MPPKRKTREETIVLGDDIRQTRSTARAAPTSDSPRKRRRAANPNDNLFASLPSASKSVKRVKTYGSTNRSRKLPPPDDSAATSPSVDERRGIRNQSEASTESSGRLIVIEAVEPSLPNKKGKVSTKSVNKTPAAPSKTSGGLNLKKSATRARRRPVTPPVIDEEEEQEQEQEIERVEEALEILAEPDAVDAVVLESLHRRTPTPDLKSAKPVTLPRTLTNAQAKCLHLQKRAVLRRLGDPYYDFEFLGKDDEAGALPNQTTQQQVRDILGGTIERSEGNSCLIAGPPGSGKSKLVEQTLREYKDDYKPIVIRLDGFVQYTDRLALREIARQVVEQTGSKTFQNIEDEDDENPFVDDSVGILPPPPSHLPSLIAALPSLSRPVVVILDAFNIFTEQPRQALLYCLLDTVQSCRASNPSQHGLAVIGITTRLDVVNVLEKRVKSRFSHRIFRTGNVRHVDDWVTILSGTLRAQPSEPLPKAWRAMWDRSVELFLQDESLQENVRHIFGISRDIRGVFRVLTQAVLMLTPHTPFLDPRSLDNGFASQQGRSRRDALMKLNYPRLALLVAAAHSRTAGHDVFSFEMLYELFSIQVRTSSAAPVMLGGGSIGMANVGRRVMMAAFEDLIAMKMFLQASSSTASSPKEFIKYRCPVGHEDVKVVVNQNGQTNLKKWFNKSH